MGVLGEGKGGCPFLLPWFASEVGAAEIWGEPGGRGEGLRRQLKVSYHGKRSSLM